MSIGTYDYDGLCEAFINQSQSCGKTAEDRMSFNRLSIYSYNSLLATLDPTNNVLLVYSDTANYSNTSKRHTRFLHEAAKELIIFSIIDGEFIDQIQEYHDSILNNLKFFKRARVKAPYFKTKVLEEFQEVKQYIQYIKLDKRTKEYKYCTSLIESIFAILLENKLL